MTNETTAAVQAAEAETLPSEERIKGEMRQSITVDRYEHGPAGGSPARNLSTQRLRERHHPALAIHGEGEGGGAQK